MYYYNITFLGSCKDCKESGNYCAELLKKLWKQLIQQLLDLHSAECRKPNSLPESLCGESRNFFQLLPKNKKIPKKNSELSNNDWLDLCENKHQDLVSEDFLKELHSFNWSDSDYAEMIAEQLHNIADSLIDKFYVFNIYWITCGHALCIESSDNIAIHGALKRLQKWNKAFLTFVCNSDIICDFTDSWLKKQDVYAVSERLIQDNKLIWHGSLEIPHDDENVENNHWCLSTTMSQSSNLPDSKEDKIPFHLEDCHVLVDNIEVICDLPGSAIPFWKILPSQFVLYHKSLQKRMFELQEKSDFDLERLDKNMLLASIATYDKKHQSQVKTTEDWMEFITSETSQHDKVKTKFPVIGTYHLVLYPVEPGVFLVYFIRPEDHFINLHSLLAVHPAIFPWTEKDEHDATWCEDTLERRWLHLLDAIQSSHLSPLKSQFSLAVHLDASEMLKHFTKDGKPMTKELKSLLKQIKEGQNISPSKQTDIQQCHEMAAGIEYCSDQTSADCTSAKLLPKHETLSICNTPKTLAKAKLHDVKRTVSKNQTSQNEMCDQPASTSSADKLDQSEQSKKKKLRGENPGISKEQNNKETEVKCYPSGKEKTKKKRRSFDGNETATDADAKEKRSDRHKRRLARVVKRALIKYGVDTSEEYFITCSERLYYLCKSFLKDLKTSEGLNNEMKKLAESNVATVVEFEKRRYTNKAGEKMQSSTTTTS